MAVRRTLRPLSKGFHRVIPAGTIINIDWLDDEQLAKLADVGAVAKVQAPPLHKFPGWKRRATRLNKIGINSVESFLEADDEWLAGKLKVRPSTVARWKQAELIDRYLTVPEKLKR